MTGKTYGRLTHRVAQNEMNAGDKFWVIEATPALTMRVKRLFPKAHQGRQGYVALTDTAEVARDIEWLVTRHPLEMTKKVRDLLTARAAEHRDQEEAVEAILSGRRKITGLREPAVTPRPYQLQAADLALTTGGLLIGDDVGLGKTFTSLLTLRDPDHLPALVVTLTHLPRQWLRELNRFMPWLTGHIVTKGEPYPVDADVLIINYHKLGGWRDHLAGEIKTVIFDEVQELRRDNTVKYHAAAAIADKAEIRVGLSATPIYNYGGETHTVFNVLKEGALGTRAEFIREWSGKEQSGGNVIVGNMGGLGDYLRDQGLLLRRTREQVGRELPKVLEIEHEIEADADAIEEIASDVRVLATRILDTSTDQRERFTLAGELDWKLRQATGIAKAPYVAAFVRLLLESEQKVALWGWHRDVYAIWNEALADFDPIMYTGSETPKQKDNAVTAFVDGTSRVFMGSLRAGAGLDGLQKVCSTVVFGELDWSPAIHHQVIGRFNRDDKVEAPVVAYYLTTNSGSDPVVADALEKKRQQAGALINPNADVFTAAAADPGRMRRLAESILNQGSNP